MLLCCSALVPSAGALDNGDPNLVLHIDGGSVSADIRAEPLVEVARALKLKTGATIYFLAPQVKDQVITAQFKNLALDVALRAILKYTNYAMVARPTEQGAGIQVYVYPDFSEGASNHGPVAGEKNGVGQAPDLAP